MNSTANYVPHFKNSAASDDDGVGDDHDDDVDVDVGVDDAVDVDVV